MNTNTLINDVPDFENICRLCLSDAEGGVSLFKKCEFGEFTTLSNFLAQLISVKIDVSDPFPDMICNECYVMVCNIHQFIRKCQKSCATLIHWCQTTATEQEVIIEQEPKDDSIDQEDDSDYVTDYLKNEYEAPQSDLSCAICYKMYSNKRTLKSHIMKTHLSVKEASVVCSYCGKLIHNKRNLDIHIKTMHTAIMVPCPLCRKKFKEPFLQRHVAVHRKDKQFLCNICGKVLKSGRTLLLHERIHSGDLEFKCLKCGKGFAVKAKFEKHLATHGWVKPDCHVCEVCNQTFRGIHTLKRHRLTHLGIKSFKCDVCGKAFYTKPEMNRHTQRHSGTPKHQCPYCEKQFWELTRLREHIMTHKKIRLHRCEFCNDAFSESKRLKHHLMVRHEVLMEKTDRIYCDPKTYIPLDKLLKL